MLFLLFLFSCKLKTKFQIWKLQKLEQKLSVCASVSVAWLGFKANRSISFSGLSCCNWARPLIILNALISFISHETQDGGDMLGRFWFEFLSQVTLMDFNELKTGLGSQILTTWIPIYIISLFIPHGCTIIWLLNFSSFRWFKVNIL